MEINDFIQIIEEEIKNIDIKKEKIKQMLIELDSKIIMQ